MTHSRVVLISLIAFAIAFVLALVPSWVISKPLVVYERPTPTPTAQPQRGVMRFVGDIMLSRSVGDMMRSRDDWVWPFARIASQTALADLTFGNLETTISSRGYQNGCGFCFRADPRAIAGLTAAGFDVLSIANNHIWDYGLTAFEDTYRFVTDAGILAVGGGRTIDEARLPKVVTVAGTRVAFLAYTDILPSLAQATSTRAGAVVYTAASASEDVLRARSLADVVVVSFHTGTEYQPLHSLHQERIYRALIDAGADIIVGHHPHVVQDIERYGRGWIVYSLGNFVFDQNWSQETRTALMLDVNLRDGAIESIATRSIDISTMYQPSLR